MIKKGLKHLLLTLLGIVILLFLWGFTEQGSIFIQKWILPQQLQVQRIVVENSKSYTDSKNTALMNFIREYTALDTKISESQGDIAPYKAQQEAIFNQMCQMISTMADGTINPNVSRFVSQHGGCY